MLNVTDFVLNPHLAILLSEKLKIRFIFITDSDRT